KKGCVQLMIVEFQGMLIGGEFRGASNGGLMEVLNPANEELIGQVPLASADEAEMALTKANEAFPAWARTPPVERARYLQAIAREVESRSEELAQLITAEEGKPITEARGEVGGTAEFFSYYAGLARTIEGEIMASDLPGEELWIRRVPHGVVAAIIPWNYPSALTARKVAPAILAGNTIVLKPHEDTPLSALAVGHITLDVGLPPGVVNIVTGPGETVGAALAASATTNFVTMTGSVEAGREVLKSAAQNITPVSLELGGKAPFIIMEDAELDVAVASALTSRYMNNGQVCICNERTYVHSSIYPEFLDRYVEGVRGLRVGDPTDESTDVGPKVNRQELDKVAAMVQGARSDGAEVALGGDVLTGDGYEKGYWYQPTVLTGVDHSMEIMHREIFGPVTPIMAFDDFDDVVRLANDSTYGLSAYLFTNDFRRIMRAVSDVRFGELYVNRIGPEAVQAFHIGYRQSGIGGDDGKHGLNTYLQPQTVYANYSGRPMDHLMPYGN
ncbi:MAG: aldehyde dehydrogenase, partial [Acidimicrobiia bacterium]